MEESHEQVSRPSSPADLGLLEREHQLERVDELVRSAAEGRGAIAAVVGGPGEGKTALLGQARQIAAAAGLRVCRARGSELEREFALGAARQLLEPVVRTLDPEARRLLLRGAAALAANVLDVDGGAARAPGQSFAAQHGLYWLLAGLAESQPVLLVLDDAHWADRASLEWLAYLGSRVEDLAVLVMIATRDRDPEAVNGPLPVLMGNPHLELLRVGVLGEGAVGTLTERALDATPDERFATSLHRVTGGNPFAVHELLKELEQAAVAPTAAAAVELGTRAPEALQRNVLMRIGRLRPAAGSAAQALAVLGDRAVPRHVAILAELDLDATAHALDALVREGTLARGPTLAFGHPLVRTAVYDALPVRRRARLHARAASILDENGADPEAVAAHLLLSDPEGSVESVRNLRAAAVAAIRRGAPSAAVTYLTRALSEPPSARERASLLAELARAETLIRSPAALGHIQEALGVSEDPMQRAHLRWLLSDVLFFAGEWDPALAQLEQALTELGERDLDLTLRLEGRLLTLGTLDARAAATARAAAEQRLSHLREHTRRKLDGARPLRLNLALLLARGAHPPAELLPLLEQGLDGGRFLERESSDAVEAVHAAFSLVLIDRLDDALAFTDAMLADATARGSVLGFLAGSTFRALANLRRGALAEAEADASPALELALEQGLHFTIPFTAGYLALILRERGRVEQAAELLAPIPLSAQLAGTPAGVTLLEARGRVHRALGDTRHAIEDLRACGEACEVIGVVNPNVAPWRSELALALRDSSPVQARELVASELALARRAGVPRGVGVALRASALLAPVAEREALLSDAVATLERSPAPLELACALIDLGAHLRRQGHRVRAREPLGRGLELAHRARAEPLATLAREELLAAGARPRRPWLTGVDALTPSELRVARLAAAGHSNQEVAQSLFITTQTVKGHLSSAYRKLGIGSRHELAGALERSPASPTSAQALLQ
jgi:DNA-binding CsgD family transcriptional regulator